MAAKTSVVLESEVASLRYSHGRSAEGSYTSSSTFCWETLDNLHKPPADWEEGGRSPGQVASDIASLAPEVPRGRNMAEWGVFRPPGRVANPCPSCGGPSFGAVSAGCWCGSVRRTVGCWTLSTVAAHPSENAHDVPSLRSTLPASLFQLRGPRPVLGRRLRDRRRRRRIPAGRRSRRPDRRRPPFPTPRRPVGGRGRRPDPGSLGGRAEVAVPSDPR